MIVLIDNYDSFTYNLYQMIAAYSDKVMVIRNDQITVEGIKALSPDGIVISPGPGRAENAGICVELVQAFAKDIPMLGVCLGMQAIAVAFGAKVIKAKELVHGKSSLVFHHRRDLYQGLPLPFEAGRYHSLMVDRATLPETLLVEAETAEGLVMGLRHQRYPVFGVQFHPESILSKDGDVIMQSFIALCEEKVSC